MTLFQNPGCILYMARGAIPPRTRTIGIDGLQNVFDNVELTDLIQDNPKQQNKRLAINRGKTVEPL